jgi:hypothetical protein
VARRRFGGAHIAVAGEADLADLVPLMRAYCDFYEVSPSDERLVATREEWVDSSLDTAPPPA